VAAEEQVLLELALLAVHMEEMVYQHIHLGDQQLVQVKI
jgi:hypothetical protein